MISQILKSLLFIFSLSTVIVSQDFFALKNGDEHKSWHLIQDYYWDIYVGGYFNTDTSFDDIEITDTMFSNSSTYFHLWDNFYKFDDQQNKLLIYLDNFDKLAVDFNKLEGGDTLFYSGTGRYYYYKGISPIEIGNYQGLKYWIEFYQITHDSVWYYPEIIKHWKVQLLDGIGQYEDFYLSTYWDPDRHYGYIDHRFTYYVKNEIGTFILIDSPQILSAELISDNQAQITWSDLEYENGYIVESRTNSHSDFSTIANLERDDTNFVAMELTENQLYIFRVRSLVDTLISVPNDSVIVSTVKAPENLRADTSQIGKIRLTWNYYSTFENDFVVERRYRIGMDDWTEYEVLDTISGGDKYIGAVDIEEYFIDSLVSFSQYFKYRVKAQSDSSFSNYSNEILVTPNFPPPNPPYNVSILFNDFEAIQLSWSDSNFIQTSVRIERRKEGQIYNVITPSYYTSSIFIDENIEQLTLYNYRLRTEFGNKYSEYVYISIESLEFLPIIDPSNFDLKLTTAVTVQLTWRDNSNNEQKFIINRGTNPSSTHVIAELERNMTFFEDLYPVLIGNDPETYYSLVAINPHSSSNIIGDYLIPTVLNEAEQPKLIFQLSQNYPNPLNPTTVINFEIPENGPVSLIIFDILGRKVETLVNEEKPAGRYEIKFDGTGLASGVYFYQLKSGNFVSTKKLILLK